MTAVARQPRKKKVDPVKKTFNLSEVAAKHADELAYVRGHSSTSSYLESLIEDAYAERKRNMMPVTLKTRRRE